MGLVILSHILFCIAECTLSWGISYLINVGVVKPMASISDFQTPSHVSMLGDFGVWYFFILIRMSNYLTWVSERGKFLILNISTLKEKSFWSIKILLRNSKAKGILKFPVKQDFRQLISTGKSINMNPCLSNHFLHGVTC